MTTEGLVGGRGGIRKLAFVGFAGTLISVGACRFAYAPLVPVMIGEGWVTAAEAGYLGAINFAGGLLILAGLLAAPPVGRVFAGRRHLNG